MNPTDPLDALMALAEQGWYENRKPEWQIEGEKLLDKACEFRMRWLYRSCIGPVFTLTVEENRILDKYNMMKTNGQQDISQAVLGMKCKIIYPPRKPFHYGDPEHPANAPIPSYYIQLKDLDWGNPVDGDKYRAEVLKRLEILEGMRTYSYPVPEGSDSIIDLINHNFQYNFWVDETENCRGAIVNLGLKPPPWSQQELFSYYYER